MVFASSTGLPRAVAVPPVPARSRRFPLLRRPPVAPARCSGPGLSSQMRPSARERRRGKHHGERHALRDVTPSAKAGDKQKFGARPDTKSGNKSSARERLVVSTGSTTKTTTASTGGVLGCPQAVLGRVGRFGGARNHRFGSRGCLAPPKPLRKASRKKRKPRAWQMRTLKERKKSPQFSLKVSAGFIPPKPFPSG